MSQERIEAAARAMSPRVWGPQVWTFAAHGESPTAARARVQRESLEQAQTGLAAADAVMFSDNAIERAAVALWNHDFPSHPIDDISELLEWTRRRRLEQARLMVAALKGDA